MHARPSQSLAFQWIAQRRMMGITINCLIKLSQRLFQLRLLDEPRTQKTCAYLENWVPRKAPSYCIVGAHFKGSSLRSNFAQSYSESIYSICQQTFYWHIASMVFRLYHLSFGTIQDCSILEIDSSKRKTILLENIQNELIRIETGNTRKNDESLSLQCLSDKLFFTFYVRRCLFSKTWLDRWKLLILSFFI